MWNNILGGNKFRVLIYFFWFLFIFYCKWSFSDGRWLFYCCFMVINDGRLYLWKIDYDEKRLGCNYDI